MDKTTEKAHVMGINVMSYPRKLTGHCNSNTCNIVTHVTLLHLRLSCDVSPPVSLVLLLLLPTPPSHRRPSHLPLSALDTALPFSAVQCCRAVQCDTVQYSALTAVLCNACCAIPITAVQCYVVVCTERKSLQLLYFYDM